MAILFMQEPISSTLICNMFKCIRVIWGPENRTFPYNHGELDSLQGPTEGDAAADALTSAL